MDSIGRETIQFKLPFSDNRGYANLSERLATLGASVEAVE
jgi:UDP-N-acetylglucosamine enolpyruvyl transferase